MSALDFRAAYFELALRIRLMQKTAAANASPAILQHAVFEAGRALDRLEAEDSSASSVTAEALHNLDYDTRQITALSTEPNLARMFEEIFRPAPSTTTGD